MPVCSPSLASEVKPLNTPEDLAQHELLHVLGYEEGWGYWLKKAGANRIDSSQGLQFDTLISALRMAELGQGVALARSSLVEHMLAQGTLIAPFEQRISTQEAFYLVYSPLVTANPQAAAFIAWLVAQAQATHDDN